MAELNSSFDQLQEKQTNISNSYSDGYINMFHSYAETENSIFRPKSSSSGKITTKESTSFKDGFVISNMVVKKKITADVPFYMKTFDAFKNKTSASSKDFSLPLLTDKQRKSCSTNASSYTSASLSQSSSLAGVTLSNINVVVRVRPMAKKGEKKEKNIIDYPGDGVLWVETGFKQSKSFTFNGIFNESSDQATFFERCGIIELIDKSLCGYSCTAFAFGATGSGKTHTITGPQDQRLETMLKDNQKYGIIPRSFKYIFDQIKLKTDIKYSVKASFLEIYNEKVKDLLNTSNQNALPVRCGREGFYAENLTKVECHELHHLFGVLSEGSAMRQVGQHLLNDYSSRSHSMLILFLDRVEPNSDVIKHGRINFVDLAGSERVKISKSAGKALVELCNINKSLLTLGNCISALGDLKKRHSHIPYRDSKLTKLLTDTLGGDGYSLMIACISPSFKDSQDSINTLRYANRAKNIKNKPIIKMDPKEQLLLELKEKVKNLKEENLYLREQFSETSSDLIMTKNPMQIKEFCCDDLLSPLMGSDTFSSFHSTDFNLNDQTSFDSTLRVTTAICALGARNGLYEMIQEYMKENERLKAENMELYHTKSLSQQKVNQATDSTIKAYEITGVHNKRDDYLRHQSAFRMASNNKFRLSEEIKNADRIKTGLPKIPYGYANIVSNKYFLNSEKSLHKEKNDIDDIKVLQLTYDKINLDDIQTSNMVEVNKQCKKMILNKQPFKKSIDCRPCKRAQKIDKQLCNSFKSGSADKPSGYAAKFAFRQEMCQHSKVHFHKDHCSSLPASKNSSPINVGYPNHSCSLYYYGSKSSESFSNKTDQLHLELEFLSNQIRTEVLQSKKNTEG